MTNSIGLIKWIIDKKNKIAKGIGIISKACKYLNINSLRTLYYSFLYPYFDYCIEVWGSATDSRIQTLIKLQKRAIHIISSSDYLSHTEPLFKRLNLQQVPKIHIYKILIFIFKVHHRTAPGIFLEMFTSNNRIHKYNTRQKDDLHVSYAKKSKMKNSITIKGVKLWNYTSKHIPYNSSIETFKKKVRNLLGNDLHYNKIIKLM